MVERFNRSLKTLIHKLMYWRQTLNWVQQVAPALRIYNSRRHRGLMNGKLSPLQAEEGENVARIQQFNAAKWERHMQKRPRPKYRVGDIVRVVERRPYQRGYNPSYSQQLYRVIQVFANLALPR